MGHLVRTTAQLLTRILTEPLLEDPVLTFTAEGVANSSGTCHSKQI